MSLRRFTTLLRMAAGVLCGVLSKKKNEKEEYITLVHHTYLYEVPTIAAPICLHDELSSTLFLRLLTMLSRDADKSGINFEQ